MADPTVGYGVLREVWFEDFEDNADSFLVRDDAGSRQSAVAGRTVRFGQSVDTSPYSTWSQTVWTGGFGQHSWSDEGMFNKGWIDATDRKGRVRMWPGWHELQGDEDNPSGDFVTATIQAPDKTIAAGGLPSLWFGLALGVVGKVEADGTVSGVFGYPTRVTAMKRIEDFGTPSINEHKIAVGRLDGKLIFIHTITHAEDDLSNDLNTEQDYQAPVWAIESFNGSVFVAQGSTLFKRSSTAWSKVQTFTDSDRIASLAVFQNRLWILVAGQGNIAYVYTSDGNTVVFAFKILDFYPQHLCEHFGSLYISGLSTQAVVDVGAGHGRGQVFKYNGTSLTTLVDFRDREEWGTDGAILLSNMVSWGRFLVVGCSGDGLGASVDESRPAFLLYYDAEEDALHRGPFVFPTPHENGGAEITNLCVWNQTIVASFLQGSVDHGGSAANKPWMMAAIRRSGSIVHDDFKSTTGYYIDGDEDDSAPYRQKLYSSWFTADTPHERKAWLTLTLTFKLGDNTILKVRWQDDGDDDGDGEVVATFDGSTTDYSDLTTVTVPLTKASGGYSASNKARYVLEFDVADPDVDQDALDTAVEDVSVRYLTAPTARRLWRLRAVCTDGQKRLNGDANTLTTKSALVAKLESYWAAGVPVKMYGPVAAGSSSPPGSPVHVQVTEFFENDYRVTSEDDEVVSEVQLTLLEVPAND